MHATGHPFPPRHRAPHTPPAHKPPTPPPPTTDARSHASVCFEEKKLRGAKRPKVLGLGLGFWLRSFVNTDTTGQSQLHTARTYSTDIYVYIYMYIHKSILHYGDPPARSTRNKDYNLNQQIPPGIFLGFSSSSKGVKESNCHNGHMPSTSMSSLPWPKTS